MKKQHTLLSGLVGVIFLAGICAGQGGEATMTEGKLAPTGEVQTATFGAGCFWCTEAVFEQIPGVLSVRSGYMGGSKPNPAYKEVCTGRTGHAEVTSISFDPARVSFSALLDTFWHMHDPTSLNRQGDDTGTQYRSAIFYHSAEQKAAAESSKAALEKSGRYERPIVTEIVAASTFYQAEDYHQDYYRQNSQAPYCRLVIEPKLKKLGMTASPGKR